MKNDIVKIKFDVLEVYWSMEFVLLKMKDFENYNNVLKNMFVCERDEISCI